jgi:hypothetical protein
MTRPPSWITLNMVQKGLANTCPDLADHEAMLWGMAIPTPFPLIAEIKVTDYPQKATVFAKHAWEKMENK